MTARKGNILVIFLAAGLVLSLATAGYFFLQTQSLVSTRDKQLQKESSTQNQESSNTNTAFPQAKTQDKTANWKTYSNSAWSISFQYPRDLTSKIVDNKQPNFDQFVVTLTKNTNIQSEQDFTVDMYARVTEDSPKYYLGGEPSGEVVHNSIKWAVLAFPQGYGDGGEAGKPFIAYQSEANGRRYVVIFYGTSEKTNYQNQILSTFKFL